MVEHDILVNLLNVGSFEELGRLVYHELLVKEPEGEGSYRKIIVAGS